MGLAEFWSFLSQVAFDTRQQTDNGHFSQLARLGRMQKRVTCVYAVLLHRPVKLILEYEETVNANF